MSQEKIHPSAIIHDDAKLGEDVRVGAYAIVGKGAKIGNGCVLHAHAIVNDGVVMGAENEVYPFAVIGGAPQDLKFEGEDVRCEIGDGNTFRESVTVHKGTKGGGGLTSIGNNNLFMAYCHIAHDDIINDHNVLANACQLAGHVEIGSHVVIGGISAVQQFVRLGDYAYIGGHSAIDRDWPPYCTGWGNRARINGVNVIGLKRKGFSREKIRAIQEAQRIYFKMNLSHGEALSQIEELSQDYDILVHFLDFIKSSKTGIIQGRSHDSEKD
jgi:UDP-N-acetylglucosamine acyltransferase